MAFVFLVVSVRLSSCVRKMEMGQVGGDSVVVGMDGFQRAGQLETEQKEEDDGRRIDAWNFELGRVRAACRLFRCQAGLGCWLGRLWSAERS